MKCPNLRRALKVGDVFTWVWEIRWCYSLQRVREVIRVEDKGTVSIITCISEERLSLKAEAVVALLALPLPVLSVDSFSPSNKSYMKSDLLSFSRVIRSSLGRGRVIKVVYSSYYQLI